MNCQEIRSGTDIASTNIPLQAHLVDCPACRQHVAEMSALRALLRQQPRLEVPGDYDFHLRARIARAQSGRQMSAMRGISLSGGDLWRTVAEWFGSSRLSLTLDLRGGVAAAAAVAALVVGLSFYNTSEETAPSLPTSDIARLSQSEEGNPSSSKALLPDSAVREASTEAATPSRTIRNSRSRVGLNQTSVEIPSTPLVVETIALNASASRSDLPSENGWRVYNTERKEMISSAQQITYLGAESSPRSTRAGTKELGFVPSI